MCTVRQRLRKNQRSGLRGPTHFFLSPIPGGQTFLRHCYVVGLGMFTVVRFGQVTFFSSPNQKLVIRFELSASYGTDVVGINPLGTSWFRCIRPLGKVGMRMSDLFICSLFVCGANEMKLTYTHSYASYINIATAPNRTRRRRSKTTDVCTADNVRPYVPCLNDN